jgi:hypothetical protein
MSLDSFPTSPSMHARDYDFIGGLRRRILVSIAATVGWLSATLLYLAFWATHYNLFQNIVVVIVSLLVLTGILLGAWVSYGLRFARRWME